MKNNPKCLDLTILLLVRLDTINRLENTLAVTKYLNSHFITNIFVVEFAPFNNCILTCSGNPIAV